MCPSQLVVSLLVLASLAFNAASQQLRYDAEINILKQRLQRECSEIADDVDEGNDGGRLYYEKLLRQLIQCQQKNIQTVSKLSSTVTTPTFPTSSTITTRVNNSQSVTPTNTPALSTPTACLLSTGDAEVSLKLLNYSNPTNQKATGEPCDTRNASPCRIYLDICISSSVSKKCDYLSLRTNVLDRSSPDIKFNVTEKKLKHLHVFITAWNRDIRHEFDSIVDEFAFNLTDLYLGGKQVLDLNGIRTAHPTRLALMFAVPCLALTVNTPPPECLTAANLTQGWKLQHDGQDIKGGGPHAHPKGYACDLRNDLGWFRFTGAAGTHILDKCPKWRSCGTYVPLWSDEAHPKVVGKVTSIRVYGVYYSGSCKKTVMAVQVMRCSLDTQFDFIYKYRQGIYNPGTCAFAFCSTN